MMNPTETANLGILHALRSIVSPVDLAAKSRRNLLAPFALVVVITIATVGYISFTAARQQDEIAVSSSIHLARSVLTKMEKDQGLLTLDYTWWDEAVQKLVLEFDLSWASHNYGAYLAENFEISSTVVVSGSNDLIYAAVKGEDAPTFRIARFGRGLEKLLAEARVSDGKGKPTPATGLVLLDGAIHLASASVISYDELV